jgi:hypothetical protein
MFVYIYIHKYIHIYIPIYLNIYTYINIHVYFLGVLRRSFEMEDIKFLRMSMARNEARYTIYNIYVYIYMNIRASGTKEEEYKGVNFSVI